MPKTEKPSIQARIKSKISSIKERLRVYKSKRPHRSFRLTKPTARRFGGKKLPSVLQLLVDSWRFTWSNKRILLGLAAIYGVVAYILVGGISQFDFIELKDATQSFF